MFSQILEAYDRFRAKFIRGGGRIVEFGCALILIGRGWFITDDRVLGEVIIRYEIGPVVYDWIGTTFILTGIAMMLGLVMPLIHDWFGRRGWTRLATNIFSAAHWRRFFIYVASFEACGFAAGLSAFKVSAWFGAMGLMVLLCYSYLCLDQAMEKDESTGADYNLHNGRDGGDAANQTSGLAQRAIKDQEGEANFGRLSTGASYHQAVR